MMIHGTSGAVIFSIFSIIPNFALSQQAGNTTAYAYDDNDVQIQNNFMGAVDVENSVLTTAIGSNTINNGKISIDGNSTIGIIGAIGTDACIEYEYDTVGNAVCNRYYRIPLNPNVSPMPPDSGLEPMGGSAFSREEKNLSNEIISDSYVEQVSIFTFPYRYITTKSKWVCIERMIESSNEDLCEERGDCNLEVSVELGSCFE